MQTLRHAHLLARLVLVWFVLSMGAALASPLVKSWVQPLGQGQAFELICSGMGMVKLKVQSDDATPAQPGPANTLKTRDCPLCATASAPPPLASLPPEPVPPLASVRQNVPSAIFAAHTAAPPAARGPPANT